MDARTVIESTKNRTNFTSTTTIKGPGSLAGILVAQGTSATIALADGQGTICNTMAVFAGSYYPIPCQFVGTLTITVGGTIDATVFTGD